MNKHTIVVNNHGRKFQFDTRIADFATFFKSIDDEDHFQLLQYPVISNSSLELIQKFLLFHDYDVTKVTSSQLLFANYKLSMKPQTLKFLSECIQPLSNKEIQQLLQAVDYFQIQSIQRIIHTFLADRYQIPYTQKKTQEILKFYGVEGLSPEKIDDLKERYLYYFKGLGKKYAQQFLQNKEQLQQ